MTRVYILYDRRTPENANVLAVGRSSGEVREAGMSGSVYQYEIAKDGKTLLNETFIGETG